MRAAAGDCGCGPNLDTSIPAMLNGDGSWKTRLLFFGERSSEQVGRIVGYLLVCKREQTWGLESEVEGSGSGGGSGGDDAEGSLFVVDGGESGGLWMGVEGSLVEWR